MPEKEKEIVPEELAAATGADGKPAYIAFQGRVIDVSHSKLWEGGLHMASHQAGQDLTAEFPEAPHGAEVLDRYPQVGVLKEPQALAGEALREVAGPSPPRALSRLLQRFPILKRHPHPMMVHFPIVFMIASTFFTILYLITGDKSYELTAVNCLGGGVIFTPLAIVTGLFTWWLNYHTQLLRPIILKIILSPILLAVAIIALVWRLVNPEILEHVAGAGIIYLLLIISLTPLVGAIGWFGSTITFPIYEAGEAAELERLERP